MIELRIDDRVVPLRRDGVVMPGYDAKDLHSVEAWRNGSEMVVEVASVAESDRAMGFAFDLNRGEEFNAKLHWATISVDGYEAFRGVATLLGVEQEAGERYYRLRLRSGGSDWADSAARTPLNRSNIQVDMRMLPTEIERSWQGDRAVRFLPLRHDSYPKPEVVTAWRRQRALMPHDYHPFISVEHLLRSMAKGSGYSIDSEWLKGDVAKRLMISGAYGQIRGEAAERDMGFKAYRTFDYTAEANNVGCVFATEPKLPSCVGAIVDSVSSEATDSEGNIFADAYNRGALKFEEGTPCFVPTRELSVAFEYKIRYITDYRIVSSKRLQGFSSVRLGVGCEVDIVMENTYEDMRSKLISGLAHKLYIFDYDEGSSYLLEGFGKMSAAVTDIVVPSGFSGEARLMVKRPGDEAYTPYDGDWAIYRGYVEPTGRRLVEFEVRSPYRKMNASDEERFNDIAFYGAEPGQQLTLCSGCSVRPLFSGCLGWGDRLGFSDIANHGISQQQLLEAVMHMFNLCIYSHEPSKTIVIEPYDDFYNGGVVDWRHRQLDTGWSMTEGAPTSSQHVRLEYGAGDGVVVRDNELSDSEFGVWLKSFDSYGTKQGVEVRSNPLFRPTISQTGFLNEASSAEVLTVGDRDSVDGGDYVEPRVVLYHGLRELPEGEHWGSNNDTHLYPYASFHSAASGLTLCFEDRDGCEGLHHYHLSEICERAERCELRCDIRLSLNDYFGLFSPTTTSASIRSTFRLSVDGAESLFRLRVIESYDPERGVARCRFGRMLNDR